MTEAQRRHPEAAESPTRTQSETLHGRHKTVTYIVLAGQAGLDVGGESIPYVAGWGESGALDAIQAYADTIDQIARRIEDAIAPANAAAIAVPVDRPVELDRAA